MGEHIVARFQGGVLFPLKTLSLPEGAVVNISIQEWWVPNIEASKLTAGSWKGLIDADKLIADIYASRLVSTRSEPRL